MAAATATAKRDLHPAGCGGDACDARDPWPLHHVRHRGGIFGRLCTSCVLKYHPGSFCSSCFEILLDFPSPSPYPPSDHHHVIHCTKCPSVVHLHCLPDPDLASQFVCQICRNPDGFSFFPVDKKMIDLVDAKVLVAAAKLSAASMSRASAAARIDAERKVKEAALARKRAREMLERALAVTKKEKEKMLEGLESALVSMPEVVGVKKKAPAVAGQKRVQSREREKWMRFHEPIPMASRPPGQGVVESDKFKGVSHVDMKDRVGRVGQLTNHVGQEEKEKKEAFLGSQLVKKEEGGTMGEADNSPRIPQPTQG